MIQNNIVDEKNNLVRLQNERTHSEKEFSFDKVLGPSTSQEDVFRECNIPMLLDRVVEGYHATIFAYGQTGAGKTYTMEGYNYSAPKDHSVPKPIFEASVQLGIIPRSINYLFERVSQEAGRSHRQFTVYCSFLQIYNERIYENEQKKIRDEQSGKCSQRLLVNVIAPNPVINQYNLLFESIWIKTSSNHSLVLFAYLLEITDSYPQQIYDLLNPAHFTEGALAPGLKLRFKNDNFIVDNLYVFEVRSAQNVFDLFHFGLNNRVVATHRLNHASSRSHSLLTITVESVDINNPDDFLTSKLQLVDLAGSERVCGSEYDSKLL